MQEPFVLAIDASLDRVAHHLADLVPHDEILVALVFEFQPVLLEKLVHRLLAGLYPDSLDIGVNSKQASFELLLQEVYLLFLEILERQRLLNVGVEDNHILDQTVQVINLLYSLVQFWVEEETLVFEILLVLFGDLEQGGEVPNTENLHHSVILEELFLGQGSEELHLSDPVRQRNEEGLVLFDTGDPFR